MDENLAKLLYLVAAILFIFGIKGLTHPRTAVRGNLFGSLGMLMAIVVTLVYQDIMHWYVVGIALAIGTAIGIGLATRIAMTAMPELVAMFNGLGGLASFLVAGAYLRDTISLQAAEAIATDPAVTQALSTPVLLAVIASGLIGGVTFSGSLVAVAKLREMPLIEKFRLPQAQLFNALFLIGALFIGGLLIVSAAPTSLPYWFVVVVAIALGVTSVAPIGGADMPVVVALLNSYSGLAAAATGFVLDEPVLIISGSLVGASGLILTKIMCDAMNRSLWNVLFGVMAEGGSTATADEVYAGKVKATSPDEAAMLFETASNVCIVPGYGMAVAQAQHAVRDLMNVLEANGTNVVFGIHPVAGRMPGHMNVLLAEADVPYEKLLEMDRINSDMEQMDIALVIGANDVVNPDARTNPNSPIAGMPIINVDHARTVIVVKRSLSPGFAGIPNPLFAADNALMMFGDGKQAMLDLVQALKS